MTDTAASFLEHYGVKGMKWGVRRKRTPGQKAAQTRKNNKALAKYANDPKTLRGARRARKQMLKDGTLTKTDIRKGNLKIGANLAAGLAIGITLGEVAARRSGL